MKPNDNDENTFTFIYVCNTVATFHNLSEIELSPKRIRKSHKKGSSHDKYYNSKKGHFCTLARFY